MSRRFRSAAIAGAVVATATVGLVVGSTNAATAQTPSQRLAHTAVVHRVAHTAPSSRIVHASSANWAGWANVGHTYTSVSASWVQPAVSCAAGETSYSSFWVGLDGDGSSSVEQTGTESDCRSGRAYYSSWYEFYPAYPVNYTNTIRPGDHLSASVTSTGSGHYTLVLTDSTQGWSHTKTGTASQGRNASAEVIAEAPSSSSGVLPLANFGSVAFSNAKVNGAALGSVATPQKITMQSGTTVKALPSSLTNNTAFSVAWKHR